MTDESTPPPCDPKIYREGEVVFVTDTISANAIEAWVKKIAAQSGQLVDWHYYAGRAIVLALGDIERVKAAIAKLMPEHDALRQEALRRLGF